MSIEDVKLSLVTGRTEGIINSQSKLPPIDFHAREGSLVDYTISGNMEQDASQQYTLSGTSPLDFISDTTPLSSWELDGNMTQTSSQEYSLSGTSPLSFISDTTTLDTWNVNGNMVQDSGTTNVPAESVTVVGVESGTDYAYFALSDFPSSAVGDTIAINVSGTNYSQKVMKIDSSYVYIENRTV